MTRPAFTLVSDDDGDELAMVSDVDRFFVPSAPEPQAWRTFELLGCSLLGRGAIGNVELRVLGDAGHPIGMYYIANATVEDVRPSATVDGLVDASVTGLLLSQPHPLAGPVWARWRSGLPSEPNLWATYDRDGRAAWLEVVRLHWQWGRPDDRPAGTTVVVDGRFATDASGLYLAIGEAVNGPGGYFGASPDALADCLCGGFGTTVPFTVEWTSANVAREAEGREPLFPGAKTSHWQTVLRVLDKAGVVVTLR
jgi:hypothetical protein